MVMGLSQHKNSGLVDHHVSGIEVPHPRHNNAIRHGYSATFLETITESDLNINMCQGYVYYNSMET